MKLRGSLAFGLLVCSALSSGASQRVSFDFPVARNLSDNNSVGLLDPRDVVVPGPGRILDVDVRLTLSGRGGGAGAWNGDLFAYLVHGSDLSILLNRPGRRM